MRAILTYHSIDPSGSPISIRVETLRRHVAFFASGRVEVVALERIREVAPERDAVAITFDDGFANFEEAAWPLFERARLPVTLFVASQRVGTTNAWGGADQPGIPTLPLLGWDALRRLVERGLSIGSHSRTHARLTALGERELADELALSADEIERELALRPRTFCYPYGEFDARVLEAARGHYELACTTELALLGQAQDPLALPRLDAFYYQGAGRLEAWGSTSFRAHLWLRATARRLRRAVAS